MKGLKFYVCGMCAALLLTSCNMSSTAKGALIGGGGGAAIGAGVGALIGKGKGAAIGAAIGTAVGASAGALIGNRIGKAKAAAAAVENAQVASVTDSNGLQAVKVTFDSGILFQTGQSTLSATAQSNLADFTRNVLLAYPDVDVSIQGYTDNQGWRNSTTAQSQQKNLELSQARAAAVSTYLRSCGASASQIKSCDGYGEANPVADNSTAAGQAQNRRVEIYLYASEAMIEAANNGTLQ